MNHLSQMQHIHMIGIGGVGMSGIAELMMNMSFNVSGSDITNNYSVKRLIDIGIPVTIGHDKKNIINADIVVYSSAIKKDNCEIRAAQSNNIPLIKRAEILSYLMSLKKGITISGSHGKTTTTSLVAHIFSEAGLDPTYVIGGKLKSDDGNSRFGLGDYFISETDESDKSFLYFNPLISVITNIDRDHLEAYENSMIELENAFIEQANNTALEGYVVICNDDIRSRSITKKINRKIISYGFSTDSDVMVNNYRCGVKSSTFDVTIKSETITFSIETILTGKHNALNTLAAIAIASVLGVNIDKIQKALKSFSGISRRLEVMGKYSNKDEDIILIDDYGHHPTEIRNTLNAIKEMWPHRTINLIFQPHRFSRTKDLLEQYINVLSDVDFLYLLDIYAAGEVAIEGIESKSLINKLHDYSPNFKGTYIENKGDLMTKITISELNNDVLLVMGAGSIGSYAAEIHTLLSNKLNK